MRATTAAAALGIAALYLAFGTAYAVRTPMWQAPDEPAHYNYIQHLARGDGFPVLQSGDYNQSYLERLTTERFPSDLPIESVRYESHQPPLYYLTMTPASGSVLAVRLASLTLGLALLALTWAIGRHLFPAEPLMSLAMLAFVALLPQHLAIAASINNDILAEVLVAAVLLASLRLGAPASPPAVHIATGVLLGAALITKTTAYAAAIIPALATTLHVTQAPTPAIRREAARTLGIIYVVALVIALPWWLRNATVYGGADILALARHAEVVAGQPAVQTWTAGHVREALATLFQSFWLQLGWMAAPAEPWVYNALAVFSGTLAAAAMPPVMAAFLSLRGAPGRRAEQRAEPVLERNKGGQSGLGTTPAIRANCLILCAVLLALALAQTSVYNAQFLQPQGRYLFPALIPIATFTALGLRELTGRWYPAGIAVMAVGLVALNTYAHLVLIPLL